jgi:hypothetical protein
MTSDWIHDDDALWAALEDALVVARSVPPEIIETGKGCYAWRGVDNELAQLMHDSLLDTALPAATRAEPAVVRALTFVARNLTIEVEISDNAVRGQVIPHQTAEVDLEFRDRDNVRVAADELGYFVITRIATTSFRLHCRTKSGLLVSTMWISCTES